MGCCKSKMELETADVNNYASFHEEVGFPTPPTNEVDTRYHDIQGESATFGCGGNFKSAQTRLSLLPGVIRSRVGYSGGSKQMDKKRTKIRDHTEVVDLEFDPTLTTFEQLIEVFWTTHDATKQHGALFNVGSPERRLEKKRESKEEQDEGKKREHSIIFYHSKEQKEIAEHALAEQDRALHSKTVVMTHIGTDISAAKHVFPAEMDLQQHLLQQDKFLSKLANCTTSEELQYSHLACKLNALISEFATPELLETALEDLNLTDDVSAYLRTKMRYNKKKSSAKVHDE